MQYNDPELQKFLGQISNDFIKVSDEIQDASYEMIQKGYKYPIFMISKDTLEFAPIFIEKDIFENNMCYHATYLELIVKNKLIEENKVKEFIENYKDPEVYCCLFCVDPQFTGIIFIPYPED